MKKILLTAVIALIGMSAWAEKPEAGTKGYLYNAAAGKFIGADAKLGDTGQQFQVSFKSADSSDPATQYPERGFDGAFYLRLNVGTSSNYLTFNGEPIVFSANYSQLVVKETAKGWLITHPYPNNQGPTWMGADNAEYYATYLQVVDGNLTVAALDENNEGAYWQFVDEDTYKKIAGPTYPIALTGGTNDIVVEYTDEPYAGTFTPVNDLSNAFQHKPFDVKEFVEYGYKYIVLDFAEPVANGWNLHAYGAGNEPFFSLEGLTQYVVEMTDADIIEDLTIFNWFGCRAPVTITACYFSKVAPKEVEPEEPEEPESAVFPAAGAQGYLYNPASGLFITGQAEVTLVAKADVTTADLYNVWYKSDSENDGKNIRFSTSATSPWTALRYNEQKLVVGDDGYCKWKLAIADDGTFTLYYPSNYAAYGPEGYLTVDPEGKTFIAVAEATEYSKWQFLTEEEFDALPTRISSVEKVAGTNAIFNVAGQQLKNLQKGLNIVNGKKVYVK